MRQVPTGAPVCRCPSGCCDRFPLGTRVTQDHKHPVDKSPRGGGSCQQEARLCPNCIPLWRAGRPLGRHPVERALGLYEGLDVGESLGCVERLAGGPFGAGTRWSVPSVSGGFLSLEGLRAQGDSGWRAPSWRRRGKPPGGGWSRLHAHNACKGSKGSWRALEGVRASARASTQVCVRKQRA